jgi:RHS repeat-associated protein
MTSGAGLTMGYDEANRIGSASPTSGGTEYYGYAPDNNRVYRLKADGTEGWTFYGARGEKLMTEMAMVGPYQNYTVQGAPMGTWYFQWGAGTPLMWFGGRLISEGGKPVYSGRLGTNRASGGRFYPYGEEISSTADDRTKFGTYNRDGFTGLDYADQRFYASSYGRFNTSDPYMASGGAVDPESWNRYAYVGGDPINGYDPRGLLTCKGDGEDEYRPGGSDCYSNSGDGGGNGKAGDDHTKAGNGGGGGFGGSGGNRTAREKEEALQEQIEQCRSGVATQLDAIKKRTDELIHKEFTPGKSVTSLTIKNAVFTGYQGAKGTLLVELGIDDLITTTIGGAAFGGIVGAIIGATAAVITLPLHPLFENLIIGLVNGAFDAAKAVGRIHCDDLIRGTTFGSPFQP